MRLLGIKMDSEMLEANQKKLIDGCRPIDIAGKMDNRTILALAPRKGVQRDSR